MPSDEIHIAFDQIHIAFDQIHTASDQTHTAFDQIHTASDVPANASRKNQFTLSEVHAVSKLILVVDDEANIRELCRLYLEQEGFTVAEAADGVEALEKVRALRPALVVLDLNMPRKGGMDVTRELAADQIPIIMLTARGDEVDKVLGLELGAEDYMTKPFSPRELVARVKVVLRRAERGAGSPSATSSGPIERLDFPDFHIDLAGRTLTVRGERIDCPPKEFDLLATLAQNPHRAFTREQLLTKVWDYSFYGDFRTVDVHIQRIRKKVEPDPEKPRYIKTVWGVGYKFETGER